MSEMGVDRRVLLEQLDQVLYELVAAHLDRDKSGNIHDLYDAVESDSFGQLIDKIVIVHIRYWHLEDAMAQEEDDAALASLRRKAEPLFKRHRPMLVAALDKSINNLVFKRNETSLGAADKFYRNWST